MYVGVVADIVPVIAPGGRRKRQKPYCGDAEVLQVVELLRQASKVSHPVACAVVERAYMQFVNDRVFIPEWVIVDVHVFACGHRACRLSSQEVLEFALSPDTPANCKDMGRHAGRVDFYIVTRTTP